MKTIDKARTVQEITVIFIILSIFLMFISCEKTELYELEKPVYKICYVRIDSIVINPDTVFEGFDRYLNIMVQHNVFNYRDSVWEWCDREYKDRAIINWGDHSCEFSFKISEKDMAIEIKPATCVTGGTSVILEFRMSINDSIVRFSGESKCIRIKINN